MEIFFTSISNREYATAFLIIFILSYCIIKSSDVIKSLLQVLKLIFFSKLTILFLIPTMYLIVVTYLMFKCNIWDYTLLKDTIFSIVGGLLLFGKAIGTDNFHKIYKDNIVGYFSAIYFFEFFVNFHDFNIFVEFVLVTFVTLVCATSTYMEYSKEETQNVKEAKQFLNGIQIFIGAFLILHSSIWVFKEPMLLFNIHSLQILLLPIIYTLFLYPICFAIYIYAKYETILTSMYVLRDNLHKQISSFKFAYKTFKLCGVNIEQLKLWQHFFLGTYGGYDVDLNIEKMVDEFKQRYKHLDSPQTDTDISLDLSLGFMTELGFPIASYKYANYSEGYGNYQALSYNTEDNNRYYCVIGNQQYPQSYMLYDYIQCADNIKTELKIFSKYCNCLYNKIFCENLKDKYISKIVKTKEFSFEKGLYTVKFILDKNHICNTMSVTFEIKKTNPTEFCEYEQQYLKQK